jgi:peptidoglycan L-alanyl-D-glutamate endopeptidase CwlK
MDLSPSVRAAALRMLELAEARGLEVLIYCTMRGNDEQANLYASGRTRPGRILTMAAPGLSLHNPQSDGKAWAFDAVPIIGGKAAWDDPARLRAMGECGEAAGLEWAGRWYGPLREMVHFQIKPEALNAKTQRA